MIGAGAVMGYTPREVGDMSLWQFAAAIDGVNKANSGNKPQAPTADEFEAMKAAHGD